MVIIVISFAKRTQRHEKRGARAASRRIRLTPDGMAGRCNPDCDVLTRTDSCVATCKTTSRRGDPPVPDESGECWQDEAHHDSEEMNVSVLPHDPRIFL